MPKLLVAYFSATQTTKRVAKKLSQVANADLFEIEPVTPYTSADLNWMDKISRSTLEMKDPSSRPEIKHKYPHMDEVDTIFLGFPIWWYVAPTIINTFLESYDFTGKTIVLFATSGGSHFGNTVVYLQKSCMNAKIIEGGILSSSISEKEIQDFLKKSI